MEIIGYFICLPLSAWLSARLYAHWAYPRQAWHRLRYRVPTLALAVPLTFELMTLPLLIARFEGRCSGWMEQGSHACGLREFLFQDWEAGLVIIALPLAAMVAWAVALAGQRLRT